MQVLIEYPLPSLITLAMITLSIIASGIFQWRLKLFTATLPENWKYSDQFSTFRMGILLLSLLLLCSFIAESVAGYLGSKGIFNHYVFSFDFTFSTLFLFGFFFINTRKTWKRYSYFLFYAIILGYLIQGGYYHPKCILPGNSSLLIFCTYFLAALLHLTDLLLENRLIYFRFYLKTNLIILFYSLISVILTSSLWAEFFETGYSSDLIYHLHALNIWLFYAFLTSVFIYETLKLRRG